MLWVTFQNDWTKDGVFGVGWGYCGPINGGDIESVHRRRPV